MKRAALLITMTFLLTHIQAQRNARNGEGYDPRMMIRVYMVFADIVDDTVSYVLPGWSDGMLPNFASEMFDYYPSNTPINYITKYFKEASFGALDVVGDYYPSLIQIHWNEFESSSRKTITRYLDALPDDDTLTSQGFGLSMFDNVSYPHGSSYYPKSNTPDNMIDMLAVFWRRNGREFSTPYGGQSTCLKNTGLNPFQGFSGINGFALMCHEHPEEVFRHEFSHNLIGGNAYHTGGAGTEGKGTFLSNIGGYGMISSYNRNLDSYNGWDRWWLGWKHPSKTYYISALNSSGNEVNTDLVYGDTLSSHEFILRNFAEYGDVIRIKLPYLQTYDDSVRNQYLWIENHQLEQGTSEYDPSKPKGIRFNIQIGNDDLSAVANRPFEKRTNYFVPLSAFGNYDFDYTAFDTTDGDIIWHDAFTSSDRANPFTGYHPAMLPAWDANLQISFVDGKIQSNEFLMVRRIMKDGEYCLGRLPVFGNEKDAFPVGASLRLGSNPPSTPLMTYCTEKRQASNGQEDNPENPARDDNRHIFLNGLRVDVIQQYVDGRIKVRIVWNDFDVDRDVRWCGPIVLSEQVLLKAGKTITLDYGLMPTRPNNPSLLNGRRVFAAPTVLTCRNGSYFKQESASKVAVVNRSALVLESGSVYEVGDGALLDIQSTGALVVKAGATFRVIGSGHIEVRDGGYICFEEGANISLQDQHSVVNLHAGSTQGLSPWLNSSEANCADIIITSFPHTGNGSINLMTVDRFIQNVTFMGNAYETGRNLRAGHHVTDQISHGNVLIENGARVIFEADDCVTLEAGTEVTQGGSLEVITR